MNVNRMVGVAALAALLALTLAACEAQPAYDPAVTPLTGIDAENVSSIKTADGAAPCGVFDVNGHGFKVVDLNDYPGCVAGIVYNVMCLNDKAAWIAENISDVKATVGTVTFTSKQEGSCGLFAAP